MIRNSVARRLVAASFALLASTLAAPAADIDPQLIARAKKEGQLTYYTDLIVEQVVRPLVAAFERQFGIKVHFTRGDSQVNSVKILNEYRAGRVQSDVFGLTSGLHVLIDAGAVRAIHHRQRRRAAAAIPRSRPLLGLVASFRHDARDQHRPGAGGAAAEEL